MAENNELGIQVGVVLDTSDIGKQLAAIGNNKDNKIKVTADTDEAKKKIQELKDDLKNSKSPAKIAIDVLKGQSNTNIGNYIKEIQDKYQTSPIKITLDVDKNATTANINKAVGEMQQQVQKAVDRAAKVNSNIKLDMTTNGAGVQLINTNQIKEARQELEGTEGIIKRIQSGIMQTIGNTQQFQPNTEIEKFNQGLGKTVTVYKEYNEELSKLAGGNVLEEVSRTYETNFQKIEQEAQKLVDYLSKQETEFNKLYSTAFEQKNPLTGEFADKALDALQKYQDEYQNVMKAGTIATDEQKRKIEELRQAAIQAIKEQQSLQQQFNTEKKQDYSGLFGQSKEWEAALKQITDAENKLNEIQKNAFSGTNALTGDFAKEATRQIDEVKNKFAEIRKTAEESFGGAATVSKDALKKMVDDLKSDLDRLAKLEYPSDKLAAQNVDVKKAFAADALVEMEERLKSLGDSTTEYYNKVQDLKTILSTVGQVDSDPSAWAKFRNEFHMLEDEIKKFEASAQGMGQKLAAGLENNQLQQITEMVDRLNNIDEKFNGAGVERLQQSLQSLAQEYMNVIEQLQNPNLSKDEYDALTNKVKDLSDQFNQAQNAVKIFNDGFKNEGDLKKYEQSADALRLRFEQLQKTYANLANKNPEIADRFREVENAINGMDPKNIGEVTRQVGNLAKECGNASGQSAGLRGALTDAFGGLGSYLARFTSSYYIITKTIQGIKKMVTAVKEVDTSLVELQKVTNLTGDSLTQFTDKAYQMGAQLGRTGKDVIDAATTFSRAGYDLNEATQLAQSALVMTNVGVDIPNMESAASDMISILKAFDIQAEESMDVIDKLYNVANKEPLDFGNITEMLVTAGGTLAQTGTSLEESMGLLTGAFATMRSPAVANG